MSDLTPMLFSVAPNGARLGKTDHKALPIEAEELAECAYDCQQAGAAMIHLHVRDDEGKHILCADRYRTATRAVKERVGNDMVVQITTEAVGMYQADEQRTLVRDVKPEAVSLGLRELLPEGGNEQEFADFWKWMRDERIWAQVILYDVADIQRLIQLRDKGIFGEGHLSILFVLGRYGKQLAQATELVPYLNAIEGQQDLDWSLCAFGQYENACVTAAACMGGHGRLGFENNRMLADGTVVKDNAQLIAQAVDCAKMVGRRPVTAQELCRKHEIC